MKIFKRFIILFLLFLCYTLVCMVSYANSVSSDLSDSVFRLHIIANSDSEEDQALKLLVRDNVLSYMKEISEGVSSKEEVMHLMESHLSDFERIATETIVSKGYDHNVNLKIGKYDFPTKVYGDITLPSGIYDALKIEIGEAKGKNWWCVMFPTLCFVDLNSASLDDEAKGVLESSLNEEEFALISNQDNSHINFKFKLVEFFENMKISLANR